MDGKSDAIPVVESGALEFAVVDPEAQRLYEVQRAAGCRTQARNVAGVRRYLGFDQRNVQRRAALRRKRDDAPLRLAGHDYAGAAKTLAYSMPRGATT